MDFRVFERLGCDVYSVFKDKRVLSLSYVPGVLVGRGREEEYFARVLTYGVLEGFLPPVIRVFGRPGSGKTAVVRNVLGRFERYQVGVFRHFYVNLKNCRTVFSAANGVLSALCGKRFPVNLGLDSVFKGIWDEFRSMHRDGIGFVCLVLDEVDSIFLDVRYDPSDFIYRFLRYHESLGEVEIRLCLIVITNNPLIFDDNLDARVVSSMGNEVVLFSPYSSNTLVEILESRLDDAFKLEMVEKGVVEYCASLVAESSGDARKVLDLMRVSGEIANERHGKVDVDCVDSALERVERDWVKDEFVNLPVNHSIVLGLIAAISVGKNHISTRELYDIYSKAEIIGSSRDIRILGYNRIHDIIRELETVGLISTWTVSRGRYGYHKEMKINLPPREVIKYYREQKEKLGFYIDDGKIDE